jgi:hypothetical protein
MGGLVEPNETLMTSAIRHCRRLVDFRLKPSRTLYLAKVINGLVDHEPVKISNYVADVLYKDLRLRDRHHTFRMATLNVDHLNDIVASYDGQLGPLPPVEIPISLAIHTAHGTTSEFSIYSWDERVKKYRCFDFGGFLTANDIENNLGIDVEIIPCFWGDIRMRDHDDSSDIWAKTIRIMKSRVSDEVLQLPYSSSHLNATTNMSRYLQK